MLTAQRVLAAAISWFCTEMTIRGIFIRPEQSRDIDAIYAVHTAAFPTEAEARLVAVLRSHDRLVLSLVAERDGLVVGHLAFSPITVEGWTTPQFALGLAPVGVLPPHQNQGVGAALIKSGLARCQALHVPFVVLLGEPEYYRRFGFSRASQLGLDNEYGADEAFMVKEILPAGLPPRGGLVRYCEEFSAL